MCGKKIGPKKNIKEGLDVPEIRFIKSNKKERKRNGVQSLENSLEILEKRKVGNEKYDKYTKKRGKGSGKNKRKQNPVKSARDYRWGRGKGRPRGLKERQVKSKFGKKVGKTYRSGQGRQGKSKCWGSGGL